MMEMNREERVALAGRISKLNYLFTADYIKALAVKSEEEKKAEAMKEKDEFCCMIMTGDWNSKVVLDCMKSCVEVIDFLLNDKEEVLQWQGAGITAMLDKANEEHEFDYSLPQAVSDILGIRFTKNVEKDNGQ